MKLLFIYNAKSGRGNSFTDGIHKLLSPATYSCNLCALTYNTFTEKRIWKEFRSENLAEMIFLHKDEFLKTYGSKWLSDYEFPTVLIEAHGKLELLITAQELNELKLPENLIALIRQRSDRY